MAILATLLHYGAKPDELRVRSTQRQQDCQSTPLYEAVTSSEKHLVEMLLEGGADPMRKGWRKVVSNHPLLLEVPYAHFYYMELPLFCAARTERSSKTQQDIILSLINHGAGERVSRRVQYKFQVSCYPVLRNVGTTKHTLRSTFNC